MANMFDMYKKKKKRAVDPDAPPRPTLLGHEKVLKDARSQMEQQQAQIQQLQSKLRELERKLSNQTAYLNAIHQTISRNK